MKRFWNALKAMLYREEPPRVDQAMWNAASEELCRQQREKQRGQASRPFGSLPTLDEFKQRARRV